MIETPFTKLVGCSVPIQQAPMGGVSSPALVEAVAEAGGVGSFTALGMPAAAIEAMLTDIRSRTKGAIAANFITGDVDREGVTAAASLARMVEFFWSDPDASLVDLVHNGGALCGWQVGSLDEAIAAERAGCDYIAVQGMEAGGHVRGDAALLPLLSATLDKVGVPVLAAGGIGDGRAVAAVLAAGAAGARMGTRFIATKESGAHDEYKQAVLRAGDAASAITDAFAVCPMCATRPTARVLRTAIDAVRAFDGETVGEATMGDQKMPLPRGSGMPPAAYVTGTVGAMAMYASDAASSVREIEPAAQVLRDLVTGAEERLARAG